jgi:hypothetical protein
METNISVSYWWIRILYRIFTVITNFLVFGLTRFERMIYRARGEHANHYTIDASWYKILSIFTITVNIRYNIRRVSFIRGGNRSTRRKPPTSASHWQTLSHNVASSTPCRGGIQTHNVSGDRQLPYDQIK